MNIAHGRLADVCKEMPGRGGETETDDLRNDDGDLRSKGKSVDNGAREDGPQNPNKLRIATNSHNFISFILPSS